jgi:hypothetical protein
LIRIKIESISKASHEKIIQHSRNRIDRYDSLLLHRSILTQAGNSNTHSSTDQDQGLSYAFIAWRLDHLG